MRGKRWVPPSVNGTPHLRLRAPNSAFWAAIRKSHQHASSIPPAKQYPLTAAIVGLPGSRREKPMGPALPAYRCLTRSSIPLRLAPAQKALSPAPVITSTLAAASPAKASMAPASATAILASTLLCTSARWGATAVTGPGRATGGEDREEG